MTLDPARVDITVLQGVDQDEVFRLLHDALPAPPFVINTPYRSGDYLTPIVPNGNTYRVMTSGTAGGAEPVWPTVLGGRVTSGGAVFMLINSKRVLDTSGYTARFMIRTGDEANTLVLSGTIGNGLIAVGYDPPVWQATTAYTGGQEVVPNTLNGWLYRCDAAGTTGGTAPVWPTALGSVVVDGTVTWRCVDDDNDVTNLRLAFTPAVTSVLADWGVGLFDVELIDAFGKVDRIMYGTAVRDPEQTR